MQTYARVGVPPSRIRTRWRFGSNRRFVATMEWLRLCPNDGFLPQIAQTLDIGGASVAGQPVRAARVRTCVNRSAISSAARAASAPLPTRASACAFVSHVSRPKETGTPVSIAAS